MAELAHPTTTHNTPSNPRPQSPPAHHRTAPTPANRGLPHFDGALGACVMAGLNIDRRQLLIGGGAGVGLLVLYAAWPRTYPANLTAAPGEHVFGGWVKVGEDGHIVVAVPQLEHGQGSWTALPQIVADEMGADWRTIAVEPAPPSPLYGNPAGLRALFEGGLESGLNDARPALMATVGSSSVRQFAPALAEAGAMARMLLCKAAAARWNVDWRTLRTAEGFVIRGDQRLRFGELAAAAAREGGDEAAPLRGEEEQNRLLGKALPRLDAPAKIDGSANFAADVRLPGMLFAAIRQAPPGGRLIGYDRAAADRVAGAKRLVASDGWLAALAQTSWAAGKALDAARPRFQGGYALDSAAIDRALVAALDGPGERLASVGDLASVFRAAQVVTADYRAGPVLHAGIETTAATARFEGGRLELWLPSQAPGAARAAAAAALGIGVAEVTLHNVFAGGALGERLESRVAEQVAVLARAAGAPVQLIWSRGEDLRQDRVRPPVLARLSARLTPQGQIAGWLTKVAAPATGRELAERLFAADLRIGAALKLGGGEGGHYAVAGAQPPYGVPNFAIDHHPVELDLPTGHWRAGLHGANVFFRECFIDELAHVARSEAMSFRIAMLGGDPRLARCLTTAAALGGWEGGVPGSGQGIACHAMRGSRIAVLAEAHYGDGGEPVVDRIVAAVDCGRMVNPELVRQQVESGLVLGLSTALGSSSRIARAMPTARRLRDLKLPQLSAIPDITVELVPSEAAFGGVAEIGVPAVAPAIANALQATTGARVRRLPLTDPA